MKIRKTCRSGDLEVTFEAEADTEAEALSLLAAAEAADDFYEPADSSDAPVEIRTVSGPPPLQLRVDPAPFVDAAKAVMEAWPNVVRQLEKAELGAMVELPTGHWAFVVPVGARAERLTDRWRLEWMHNPLARPVGTELPANEVMVDERGFVWHKTAAKDAPIGIRQTIPTLSADGSVELQDVTRRNDPPQPIVVEGNQ